MGKLIIQNVIIEKSNKDINTGISYEFSGNFNLICGNNETGKSSLMNFIKNGFFKVKGIDTGKIFFSLIENNSSKLYRTDIQDAKKLDSRCKIYDEDNNNCNYDIIEKIINQNYFEQGFTINLDDLMSIQNKDTQTLINTIKDPAGDKLTNYINQTKTEIKKLFGDNGRLTKESASILERINLINSKINELSSKESEYNFILNSIKTLDEEIEKLTYTEKYLNIIILINEIEEKINLQNNEKQKLIINFNQNLYDKKQEYIIIIENAGKYNSNLNLLERANSKFEDIKNKLNESANFLENEYSITYNEENINDFIIDKIKINKIKELINYKNSFEKEKITYSSFLDNIQESAIKLKHDINLLEDKNTDTTNIKDLKDTFKFLDEGLKQYNYIINEINNINYNNKNQIFSSNQSILINLILIILISLSVISSIFSFINNIKIVGIISILISFISLSFLFFVKNLSKNNVDITKKIEIKNNILIELKNTAQKYDNNISNMDNTYLPVKIESIKQEINNRIQNKINISEQITQKNNELQLINEKINNTQKKIDEINKQIDSTQNEINNIRNNDTIKLQISDIKYLEFIEFIKKIKTELKEKISIESEINELTNQNNEIVKYMNNFIIENNINISDFQNFKETLDKLKILAENNSNIKNQIELINVDLNNLNNQKEKLFKEKENLNINENYSFYSVSEQIVKIKEEKELKLNLKKEAEFKKRELENFEGLDELKLQKNILEDEYKSKITEITKNKLILKITEIAKNNFDKTQPDLQNAQKFLSILTDKKYTKINLDLQEISNDNFTLTKKWNELSRGTKEQLYLALRLGYASNYSKDKTTLEPNGKFDLPLIIDDAFVNFDYIRTKNALKCLTEFSKSNQVLFFTCHTNLIKNIVENIIENKETLNIINLE